MVLLALVVLQMSHTSGIFDYTLGVVAAGAQREKEEPGLEEGSG
jgi:hypothetical protein